MKNFIKMTCLLAGTFSAIQAQNVSSQTFFSARQVYRTATPVKDSFFRNDLLHECPCLGGSFEAVVYGGRTTCEGRRKLAEFFLPGGCISNCLNTHEFNSLQEIGNTPITEDGTNIKEIEARNFNIHTADETFASKLCFRPEQKLLGIGLTYRQTLWRKCNGSTGAWFEASLPIERIEHCIELNETIINDGGGVRNDIIGLDGRQPVGNMTEAFAQSNWLYGKIDCRCPREKWGIADIELKVGYNTVSCTTCILNSFMGIIIPAGNRIKGHYLFEPVVGNNHHFGVLFGNSIGFELWRKCNKSITMYIDTATRYLFRNTQRRSFDLINRGPWSRYLAVYRNQEEAAAAFADESSDSGTSGINVFTQCFRVKPHLNADINTGFIFEKQCGCGSWIVEAGYNLFARQAETLELADCNALRDIAIKSTTGLGNTSFARTIKNNFVRSDVLFSEGYARVSPCDIDYESAAHPATIAHIFYGTFGYKWEKGCPCFAAFGGSYEFTPHEINTALNRWQVWGKFGFTF